MKIHHLLPWVAVAASLAAGCIGGGGGRAGQGAACAPSTPTAFPDPTCAVPLVCASATGTCDYAVCPSGATTTFTGVKAIFTSCVSCHTPTPAATTPCNGAPCGGLDLETDPHGALVGVTANNADGTANPILLVKASDPGNSLLYRKLTITTTASLLYGRGMPYATPGSVCPAALAAVKGWIDAGALND